MNKTDVSSYGLNECGCCQGCEHSFEDESVNGDWHLYCIKKLHCRDGSQVSPWGRCGEFEEKTYKRR